MSFRNKSRILLFAVLVLVVNVAAASAQTSIGPNRKTPLYQNPVFDSDFPDPTVIRRAKRRVARART